MDENIDTIERTEHKVKQPNLYVVRLLNDDFTPFDFVIALLIEVFHKSMEEAQAITADIHKSGSGTVGIYTRDIAETKVQIVARTARAHEHPLQATIDQA